MCESPWVTLCCYNSTVKMPNEEFFRNDYTIQIVLTRNHVTSKRTKIEFYIKKKKKLYQDKNVKLHDYYESRVKASISLAARVSRDHNFQRRKSQRTCIYNTLGTCSGKALNSPPNGNPIYRFKRRTLGDRSTQLVLKESV